jgi:signal transduction histidine kinase
MNHAILHLSLDGPLEALPWNVDFNARGIVMLKANSTREARSYFKAYPVLLVLVDLPQEETPEQAGMLTELAAQRDALAPPPLLGLYAGELTAARRAALANCGVDDLICREDPERFLVWHVEMLLLLNELRRFEQTRLDVTALAKSTRDQLHDLSQPLSAVQGRLQLMAARCAEGDPNQQTFQDLVRLILDVSRHVMEIQQLHRKYS